MVLTLLRHIVLHLADGTPTEPVSPTLLREILRGLTIPLKLNLRYEK